MRFLIIRMLAWFNSLVNIYRFKKASGIFRKLFFTFDSKNIIYSGEILKKMSKLTHAVCYDVN